MKAGWSASDLDEAGECHAFQLRLHVWGPGPALLRNCPEGFRTICGKVSKSMRTLYAGTLALKEYFELPKCEVCQTLLGEGEMLSWDRS
jgi:hypothetical protein